MRPAVRPAAPADLPQLARSLGQRQFFAERLSLQQKGHGLLLAAWLADEPVGDVYIRLADADEPELRQRLPGVALLQHLEVREDRRNRGIGSALLHAAEQVLRDRDHRRVALGVAPGNHAAARLYHRHGYRQWPYPPIITTFEEFLENGHRRQGEEICQVFVKQLSDVRGAGPPDN